MENKDNKQEDTGVEAEKAQHGDMGTEAKDSPYYVRFNSPYHFEKKDYDGVDLDKISSLTTMEKIEVDRIYERLEPVKPRNPVLSTMYAVCVAAYITNLPMEFFYSMKNSEFLKIETAVKRGFFMPV